MLKNIEEKMAVEFKGVNKDELMEMVKFLVEKVKSGGKGEGKRKLEVLGLLEGEALSISEIGDKLGINSRNVSSILSMLKKDGYRIWNDEDGKKMLKGKRESVESEEGGEGGEEV